MPYLTGESLPPETLCGRLLIPNDAQVIANVNGALLELTDPDNWEAFGVTSVDDTVTAMRAMVDAFFEDACEGTGMTVRVDPENNCILQQSADGGDTWTNLIDVSECASAGPTGPQGDPGATGSNGTNGTDASAPTGGILAFAGAAAPTGYLLCNGAIVSRATYAALFTAIGTAFGVGDGSTTFAVPDLRGRTGIGVGTGTGLTARALADQVGTQTHVLTVAELAVHHHYHDHVHGLDYASGTPGVRRVNTTSNSGNGGVVTGNGPANANTNDEGSGTAHNNMQPSLALNYIIKT